MDIFEASRKGVPWCVECERPRDDVRLCRDARLRCVECLGEPNEGAGMSEEEKTPEHVVSKGDGRDADVRQGPEEPNPEGVADPAAVAAEDDAAGEDAVGGD